MPPNKKSSRPGVVPGLERPASVAAPVAAPSAPSRSRKVCPICRARVATTEVSIGPVNVKVCEPCGAAAFHGMGLLSAVRGWFR